MKKFLLLAATAIVGFSAAAQTLPEEGVWYQLISMASNTPRQGCGIGVQISVDEPARIGGYNDTNSQANRLWAQNTLSYGDTNFDNQVWKFEQDPDNPGHYAMICKAYPDGFAYLNTSISTGAATARWDYNTTGDTSDSTNGKNAKYGITFCTTQDAWHGADGDDFFLVMTSINANTGWYFNVAAYGQRHAIHLFNDPTDGNGSLIKFVKVDQYAEHVAAPEFPKQGVWYTMTSKANGDRGGRYFNYDTTTENNYVWTKEAGSQIDDTYLWRFEWSETKAAYAMICMSNEAGYINAQPLGTGFGSAYWQYSTDSTHKYGFSVAAVNDPEGAYEIRSIHTPADNYLNCAANFRVNYYAKGGGVGNHNNAIFWDIKEYKPGEATAKHNDTEVSSVNMFGLTGKQVIVVEIPDGHTLWYKWVDAEAPMLLAETDDDGFTKYEGTENVYRHDVTGVGALSYYTEKYGVKGDVKTVSVVNESTNSIDDINANGRKVVYDLQGRRLAAPVKGINIINGQKVLVK